MELGEALVASRDEAPGVEVRTTLTDHYQSEQESSALRPGRMSIALQCSHHTLRDHNDMPISITMLITKGVPIRLRIHPTVTRYHTYA